MSSAHTKTGAAGILGLQAGEDVNQAFAGAAGKFDHLVCRHPLPVEGRGLHLLEFQTRSFEAPKMDRFEIREDGSLWRQAYDARVELFPTAPSSFVMHRDNERWVRHGWSGELRFYTGRQGAGSAGDGWLELSATFDNGRLQHVGCAQATGIVSQH